MLTNNVSKFSKIELLLKNNLKTNDLTSITKIEFLDCNFVITGDYMIITVDECDENENENDNTLTNTGKIFNLNGISAYKTHTK